MIFPAQTIPKSEEELLDRAIRLNGFSLGELAQFANIPIPADFRRYKGYTGQVIELYLGASAGAKPEQDFPHLGIELKTIPVNSKLAPLETTYVCMTPLMELQNINWHNSSVRNKLSKVLWIPVQGDRSIAPKDRIIGHPVLWSPSAHEEQVLKQDWEQIMELICAGDIESISARVGEVLQLRPKAANSKALTDAIGPGGELIKTLPRGFYLKKAFTQNILILTN